MNEVNQQTFENTLKTDTEFNLRKAVFKYLRYWYWFILAITVAISVAYLYLRYATPIYEVRSTLVIKDDKGGVSQQNILSELDIFNTKSNVGDEIEVLKTRSLMEKVVEELKLNISYFALGNIKTNELYKSSPFYISLLTVRDSIPAQQFNLEPTKDAGFVLTHNKEKHSYNFEDTISMPYLTMVVHKNANFPFTESSYLLNIASSDGATDAYLKNVSIILVNKLTNVIEMTMNTTIPAKGEDVLNKLYEVYTRINREDKNKIADSTINFINDRLGRVTDELSDVEKNVEQFKKENSISSDIKEQSSLLLGNISELEKQIIQQEVEINVLESIQEHLKSNIYRVVPGALIIEDPSYLSMVEKYNSLVLERDNNLQTARENNPLIEGLTTQIQIIRGNLLTSLANIKRGMLIARTELAQKRNQLLSEVNLAPSKERAFMEISRQQEVKKQLYLFLLQKREETAISKSGTLANSRLIDPAKSSRIPFKPNRKAVFILALVAGLIIPTLIIYLKDLLNNKIVSKTDITSATNVTVIGELGHNSTGESVIAKQDSRTALAEQFRLIRTNLQFILKGKENQIILFTSSMSGEGKSFISLNLASSLAISGKKVVLMELDLRKPKISKMLGLRGDVGFTNFVISDIPKATILQNSGIHPNLFVISAGIIPPNPAELILQEKVTQLFNDLREEFDFIIVDTAPVGLVTDALLISKYSDANIYVM
jgi:tyrosine-protein kinase Etk/Wzc